MADEDQRVVDLDEAERAARVAALIDAAPPLTPEQGLRVRDILAGATGPVRAVPDVEDDDD